MIRGLCGAALLLATTGAGTAATTLAKSLPVHQLHALKSLVARELEEKWADADTAEWASHLCGHNGSYARHLGNVDKMPLIGVVAIRDSPRQEASAESLGSDLAVPGWAELAAGRGSSSASLAAIEVQAARLDFLVSRRRMGRSAQSWRLPWASVPALGDRQRQLRPVSVSFGEHLGGHVLPRSESRSPKPQAPLVRSLASLWAELA
uniref:Subtilisin n=1 Tax=Alexandrium catenella TaxID=2925 RepID=A0A7S1WTX4_ALECA